MPMTSKEKTDTRKAALTAAAIRDGWTRYSTALTDWLHGRARLIPMNNGSGEFIILYAAPAGRTLRIVNRYGQAEKVCGSVDEAIGEIRRWFVSGVDWEPKDGSR